MRPPLPSEPAAPVSHGLRGDLLFPRLLGATAALAAASLWVVFVFANPYRPPGLGPRWVAAVQFVLALAAVCAAWRSRGGWMISTGVVAFLPVGLYTLASPGAFVAIGVCHLLWIACGIGLVRRRR